MSAHPLPCRRAVLVYCGSFLAVLAAVFLVAFLTRHRGPGPARPASGPPSVRAFLAAAPRTPAILSGRCRLADSYVAEFPRAVPAVGRTGGVLDAHALIQAEVLAGPGYHCVRLEDEGGDYVFAYAPAGSALDRRLTELLGGGPRRLTLEVQCKGPSPERVLIRRLLE